VVVVEPLLLEPQALGTTASAATATRTAIRPPHHTNFDLLARANPLRGLFITFVSLVT
jgi:hypothetical protein